MELDRHLACWAYCSVGAASVNEPVVLQNIVELSKARNHGLGVTGALIFTGARFGQYIEGPAAAVAALRSSISEDTRHSGLATIADEPLMTRLYPDWTLAFSGDAEPYDRLLAFCSQREPWLAKKLLLEMIRRLTAPLHPVVKHSQVIE
jgi:hypothetical protein